MTSGYLANHLLEAVVAALRAGVTELTVGVDDFTLVVDGLHELLGDRGSHVDVVWLDEGQEVVFHVRFRILNQPGVHDDQRNVVADDHLGAIDQRIGRRRVQGNEVQVLTGNRLQRRKLLRRLELAVEGLDLDAEQAADELGGLDTMGNPGGGRADFDRRHSVLHCRKIVRENTEIVRVRSPPIHPDADHPSRPTFRDLHHRRQTPGA